VKKVKEAIQGRKEGDEGKAEKEENA
jgi:hypothetical protein